jgi:hypothetical protein
MKAVPSYGKLLTLGSAYTENALVGDVIVQEKIDGSQFGFGVNEDGEVVMRSKGAVLTEDNHADMFNKAVEYIMSIRKALQTIGNDVYFYAEYLQSPKHNTLKYAEVPTNHIIVFDAVAQGRYATREELIKYVDFLGVDLIPELYRGKMTIEQVKDFLTIQSYLGGEVLEGIVIKNYTQTILLGGQVFPLFTKYVREAFKERHSVEWKIKQPKDNLQIWIEGFKSEARWQKAVIHLREKGLLTQSPKDIGLLIPEIKRDIIEEESENIKNYLYKCFIDDILRKATNRAPEWYKEQLLLNIKNDETESNIN